MNCTDARFALAANPGDDDAALAAHLDGCAACARYAAEMADLDRRVLGALRVDVPASARAATTTDVAAATDPAASNRAALPATRPRRRPVRSPLLALAASLAGVAVLVALLGIAFPRETLAAALVEHMSHEPHAWEASTPMPASAIAYALSRTGVRLAGDLSDVTYAHTCWFRGRGVPHLVVRSAAGPVTIMVLPHESVARRVPFDEGGYRGVLVPAARGSIAVLVRDATDVDVDGSAARAAAAIRYLD